MQLATVENRLTLFVEGMLGHYLHLKPRESFEGTAELGLFSSQAVDTLYLPTELPRGSADAYRVLAMRQVAQRLFGSFQFRLQPFLDGHPDLGDQAHERGGLRLGELQQLRCRYRYPRLFQALFEALEAIRIDARTVAAFPGLRRPLRAQLASSANLLLDPAQDPPPLLTATFSRWRNAHRTALQKPAGEAETLVQALHDPAADVYRSVLLADRCYKALPLASLDATLTELPETVAAAGPDEQGQSSGDWMERDARLKDWQEELAALEGMLLDPDALLEDDVEVGHRSGLGGSPRPEDQHFDKKSDKQVEALAREQEQLNRRIEQERAALRHALGPPHSGSRSYRYPEWNYLEHRYLGAWCTLYERPITVTAGEDPQALKRRVRRWQDELRTRLAQVRPLGLQRRHGVEDGDELDFNAVLDARLDSAAGLVPDAAVYSRRERVQRDLSAAFLVDLSASTDDPVEPPEWDPGAADDEDDPSPATLWSNTPSAAPEEPEEEPRRIIDVLREAMLAMAFALEQLGDEYGVYGFSGYGRDQVEYYVAKELGVPFTPQALHRIAAMKPHRSTRMGPALRHTIEKLKRADQQLKLLVMLSDGFPQDSDYGPTRGDHEYGLEDTAQALAEAAAAGIRTFCITVDKSGNDYLKRMCRDAQYLVIDDVEDLPAALSKVYRNLTS